MAAVAVGLLYAALYEGISEATSFGSITAGSTFWPGAGLTLAVLLLRPRSEWPWFIAAVAGAEIAMDVRADVSLGVAIGWGVANTAEPALAAHLLRRRDGQLPDLTRVGGVGRFFAAAGIAGPLLGATIGALVPAIVEGMAVWPRLPRWYLGDAIGALTIAPALILFAIGSRPQLRWSTLWPFAALFAVGIGAVGPWEYTADAGMPFLLLPMLAIIGFRLRTPGAAAAVLIVALIVELVTAAGEGPFAHAGAFDGLVVAQMFLATAAFTAFMVAALASDLVGRDEVEARLREQALRDSLTGLANRRLLFDRLGVASRRLERQPGYMALLYVDLDRFKDVNDRLGHAAGDAVLCEAADRISAVVRGGDTVARIGGDEFAVVATDMADPDGADRLAQRLRSRLAAPFSWQGTPIQIRASIGAATTGTPLDDLDAFVVEADRAMYRAKRQAGTDNRRIRVPA